MTPDEVAGRWPYLKPAQLAAVLMLERDLSVRAAAATLRISPAVEPRPPRRS